MSYLSYKKYSYAASTSEDEYYYEINKVEYLNHELSVDKRLRWPADGATLTYSNKKAPELTEALECGMDET